ncbi:MAG: hypothetical protein AB7O91_09885 [Sphingomonas sp.]
MSLRVRASPNGFPTPPPIPGTPLAPPPPPPPPAADGWGARIAKLLPGESLALIGAAQPFVGAPDAPNRWIGESLVIGAALLLTIVLRARATSAAGRGAQWAAVAISVISLLLWVVATGEPISPLPHFTGEELAALVAFLWATLVPYFYKGD